MVYAKYLFFILMIIFSLSVSAQNKSVPIAKCQEKNGKEVKVFAFLKKNTNDGKSLLTIITSNENFINSKNRVSDSTEIVVASGEVVKYKNGIKILNNTVGSLKRFIKLPCIKDALMRELKIKKSISI